MSVLAASSSLSSHPANFKGAISFSIVHGYYNVHLYEEQQWARAQIENQKNFPKDQGRMEASVRSLGVQVLVFSLSMVSGYISTKDSVKAGDPSR